MTWPLLSRELSKIIRSTGAILNDYSTAVPVSVARHLQHSAPCISPDLELPTRRRWVDLCSCGV